MLCDRMGKTSNTCTNNNFCKGNKVWAGYYRLLEKNLKQPRHTSLPLFIGYAYE